MKQLRNWLSEQLDLTSSNIVKYELEGDMLTAEFARGQWNVLNHLKNKLDAGHFI